MAEIVPRSSIVQPGQVVRLLAIFKTANGTFVDLDTFPMVTIIQPSGNVAFGPSSAGVYHNSTGVYGYDFDVCLQPTVGTYRDFWQGTLSGSPIAGEFTFTVYTTQLPAINSDGYLHLGDVPAYGFSQCAIRNINWCIELLRKRLKSSGKHKSKDKYGNDILEDCDIFATDQLVDFLVDALGAFNETPTFTMFTWDDTNIIQQFYSILVQRASITALASQALIERGREFSISDNGINFVPPGVSDILNTQYQSELANWTERVKLIKFNMKPNPLGLGTWSTSAGGTAPQVRRLRWLRERQIL